MILWANYNGIPNFKRSACSVFCGSCLFNSSVFLAARIELCFVNDDVVPWFPCHKGFHDTNIAIFLLVVVVGRFFHTFQEPRKKQKNTKKKNNESEVFSLKWHSAPGWHFAVSGQPPHCSEVTILVGFQDRQPAKLCFSLHINNTWSLYRRWKPKYDSIQFHIMDI